MTEQPPHPGGWARARPWLALLSPMVILAATFTPVVGYLSSVKGLQGEELTRAMEGLAPFPATLGFACVFLVTRWLARVDGLTMSELGWSRPSTVDLVVAVGVAAIIITLNAYVFHPLIQAASPAFDPTLRVVALPTAMVMMGVASVAEDTLFRGYAWVLLRRRAGTVVATVVTSLFYAPLAGNQGPALVAWAVGFGVVLCAVRAWRGNLWPVSVVHAVVALGPAVWARL